MNLYIKLNTKALWGLGNIAGDMKEYRLTLFHGGIFERLLASLQKYMMGPQESLKVLQHGVWLLANLCKDKLNHNDVITYPAVPILCKLYERFQGDSYLLVNISWTLLQLGMVYISIRCFIYEKMIIFIFIEENEDSKENDDNVKFFIGSGVFKLITSLLK